MSLVNIAEGANVTTEGLSEKHAEEAQNVTDGDYTTFLTVTKGKKYYYKVRAYKKTANGNVYSSYSTPVVVNPKVGL